MRARRRVPVLVALLLLGALAAGLLLGPVDVPAGEVVQALGGGGSFQARTIVLHVRLPRLAVGVLVGAGLALSGAILQGVVRNVLAEPGLLGINAGAGLAAAIYVAGISLKDDRVVPATSTGALLGLPATALLGAGLAAALVHLLAHRRGLTPWRLVLVGVAVSHGLAAATIVVLTRMTATQVSYAKIWLTGSIWSAHWSSVLLVGPLLALLGGLTLARARRLDVLALGEDAATGLGLPVERERRIFLALAAGLAGAGVAVAGTIGFLGLFAPHIARRLVGVRHGPLLPTAALIGGLTLVLADLLGRTLIAPREIPAGVIVAAVGAPYFLFLLVRSRT